MPALLRKVFTLDPSPSAHVLRCVFALVIKLPIFMLLLSDAHQQPHMGALGVRDGDTWEYVDPIESMLAGKGYAPDHRMPGYGAVWLGLRTFLSYSHSASAITVLQLLLSSVATCLLAWTLYRITLSARAFWIAFVLLAVSTYHARTEFIVMNESFTTSAIALHWVFFAAWRRKGAITWLVASGAMLGWAVFMRPIYAPLLAVAPLILFFHRTAYWRQRIVLPVFFLLPFALADGLWIARNHRAHGAFRPLTNGTFSAEFEASPYYAAIKLLQSYGGNYNFWDPTADIRWFGFRERHSEGQRMLADAFTPPPAYAHLPGYGPDSLEAFARTLMRAKNADLPAVVRDSATLEAHRFADAYRAAYAKARPFQYQVMARLRYLRHMLVHSGTSVLFNAPWSAMPVWMKAFKLGQSALYVFTFLAGPAMALLLLRRRERGPVALLLAAIVWYGILAHPFLVRLCEVRYLIPTWPLTLLAAAWAVGRLWDRWRPGAAATSA